MSAPTPFEVPNRADKRGDFGHGSGNKVGEDKLTSSDFVTVRLDPKLRYLSELAARKQQCTLSGFIEWAIEDSLSRFMLHRECDPHDSRTVLEYASLLWDVDETGRFARLAILYPELLSNREQEIWTLLNDSLLLDPARKRNNEGNPEWDWGVLEDKIFPMLRVIAPGLMMSYVEGDASARHWVESMKEMVSRGEIYSDYCREESDDFRK